MSYRFIALTLAAAFVTLTLCGWGFFMLQHDHGMAVVACPFTGQATNCSSNTSDHLYRYSLFIGSIAVRTLVALLIILVLGLLSVSQPPSPIRERHRPHASRISPNTTLWKPLQLAFSDGILNPKDF